ncbi:MAG: hypothetical protein K2W81_13915 [Sphingomonas sp.]|uniref:hypothetical protein n=1 Tax=Sphingomonas sp. TaxID=28214 RepID=UPI0025F9ED38|nr:hypothetical protein [Sphingomonas sp.]MBY0285043.1 hypothetical protein [Sphingomonas sp.]
MRPARQSSLHCLAAGALFLGGCSEACGCSNNARAVRDWAGCATSAIDRTGSRKFADHYVGRRVRGEPTSTAQELRWQYLVGDIDKSCGTFATALKRAQQARANGYVEDNAVQVTSAIEALSLHGLGDLGNHLQAVSPRRTEMH